MVLSSTLPRIILFDHTMKEETSISGVQGSVLSSQQSPPPPQEWGLGDVLLLFGLSTGKTLLKGITSSQPRLPKLQWKDMPASKFGAQGPILQVKSPGKHCVPVLSQDRTELLVSIGVPTSHRPSGDSLTKHQGL